LRGKTNKHDHFRDEAEKGLLLTIRAPDTSTVRSPSKEDTVSEKNPQSHNEEQQPLKSTLTNKDGLCFC